MPTAVRRGCARRCRRRRGGAIRRRCRVRRRSAALMPAAAARRAAGRRRGRSPRDARGVAPRVRRRAGVRRRAPGRPRRRARRCPTAAADRSTQSGGRGGFEGGAVAGTLDQPDRQLGIPAHLPGFAERAGGASTLHGDTPRRRRARRGGAGGATCAPGRGAQVDLDGSGFGTHGRAGPTSPAWRRRGRAAPAAPRRGPHRSRRR